MVPIKRFADAKRRLAGIVSAEDRAELARAMAGRVLLAGNGLTNIVVSNDDDVALWARARGADVVRDNGGGLNAAVRAGVDFARAAGFDTAIVIHADIPLARGLDRFGGVDQQTAVLVPDARNEGTNVLVIPTALQMEFHYGAGSFDRHHRELLRLGLRVVVAPDAHLGADVDNPCDLAFARAAGVWPIRGTGRASGTVGR